MQIEKVDGDSVTAPSGLDAWAESVNVKHVFMRAVGAGLALIGGILLAVYSAR